MEIEEKGEVHGRPKHSMKKNKGIDKMVKDLSKKGYYFDFSQMGQKDVLTIKFDTSRPEIKIRMQDIQVVRDNGSDWDVITRRGNTLTLSKFEAEIIIT